MTSRGILPPIPGTGAPGLPRGSRGPLPPLLVCADVVNGCASAGSFEAVNSGWPRSVGHVAHETAYFSMFMGPRTGSRIQFRESRTLAHFGVVSAAVVVSASQHGRMVRSWPSPWGPRGRADPGAWAIALVRDGVRRRWPERADRRSARPWGPGGRKPHQTAFRRQNGVQSCR
jgi:hypothetical protein